MRLFPDVTESIVSAGWQTPPFDLTFKTVSVYVSQVISRTVNMKKVTIDTKVTLGRPE